MINNLSLADSYVFVKPLTSESPVDKYGDGMSVPTLEKLLVDINADDDFFTFKVMSRFTSSAMRLKDSVSMKRDCSDMPAGAILSH